MTCPIYIALVHHPVLNKHGEVVTTAVTNFDIHDLARTGSTFGVKSCFIVTPIEAQQNMVRYIHSYWREGYGATFNPDRQEAFQTIEIAKDISETCLTIKKRHGSCPRLVATTAKVTPQAISFQKLRDELPGQQDPLLLVFGTGWGLTPEFLDKASDILEPIAGPTPYNHLPVRSAVAIALDRLFGIKTESL